MTFVDLFPNTDSKSTLRPAEGCGCATGDGLNPKKKQNENMLNFLLLLRVKYSDYKLIMVMVKEWGKAINSLNKKAGFSSKMFFPLPHILET